MGKVFVLDKNKGYHITVSAKDYRQITLAYTFLPSVYTLRSFIISLVNRRELLHCKRERLLNSMVVRFFLQT